MSPEALARGEKEKHQHKREGRAPVGSLAGRASGPTRRAIQCYVSAAPGLGLTDSGAEVAQ